jgi:hypothetical protein
MCLLPLLQFRIDETAVHLYMIFFGIGFGAKLGHDLSIYRHLAGYDKFLRRTTRRDTRLSDQFL